MRKNLFRIVVALAVAVAPMPAAAEEAPRRIVSLNLCADQLLLALAEPERIVALSPNAQDREMSHHADQALDHPMVSGTAEEVLALKPDLVLAGPFAGAESKAFLRAAGLRVIEVPVPETLADVAAQIREMGELLGDAGKAERLASDFEAAVAAIRLDATGARPNALYVQRRGFVTGHGTLMHELMETAGLGNAVRESGFARYDLETLLTLDADLIVLEALPEPTDQGAAMLLHPALEARFGAVPRVVVPLTALVCPGPWTVEALHVLADAAGALGNKRSRAGAPSAQ